MSSTAAGPTLISARYWRLHQDTATRYASTGYEWHMNSFTMTGIYLSNGSPATASTLNTTASSVRSNSAIANFFSTTQYGVFNSFQAGEYLLTDFGAPAIITAVTLKDAVGINWAPTQYSIQYSSNNIDWTTIVSVYDVQTPQTGVQSITVQQVDFQN